MMKRIICVGNRYVAEDAAGSRVYDLLVRRSLPQGVEAIDGGLAGLDLLRFVDGAERLVFVDTVAGYGRAGEVCVFDPIEAPAGAATRYDHAAGLSYLLRVLPDVCDGAVPEVLIVGIEGPADGAAIAAAADICVEAAVGGLGRYAAESTRSSGERK